MVLVQFLLTTATLTTYAVPISGKCSIRVLNMVYHSTAGANSSESVQLVSDALFLPYSPLRYITMINQPSGTLNFDQGFNEYNFQNVVLNGQIQLGAQQVGGAGLTSFDKLLLTLEIEKINETFIPKLENPERQIRQSSS